MALRKAGIHSAEYASEYVAVTPGFSVNTNGQPCTCWVESDDVMVVVDG